MSSYVLVALMVSAMAIACGEETRSQQSTIIVTSASYGRNCAPLETGNATNSVKIACDGKTSCEYDIQAATLGADPCVGTHKDFSYSWSCSGNSDPKTGRIPGEASGSSASLSCP
jgi:hypothetical protein